jgi:poly(A) polymerase Pap1
VGREFRNALGHADQHARRRFVVARLSEGCVWVGAWMRVCQFLSNASAVIASRAL